MTAAPRSGGTEKVQCRLPEYLVKKMDEEVLSGEYSSRSEFIRHLVEEHFTSTDMMEGLDVTIDQRINEGRYDEALRKRMMEIISEQFLKK